MARKRPAAKAATSPQFDDAPLDADDDEGACPIPDEHGEVVLRRGKPPRKEARRGGKGTKEKPAR